MTASVRRARAESRALRDAAATLAREAQNLERAADAKEEFAAQLARLAQIPEAVRCIKDWIDRGRSESEAIAIAADVHEIRSDALAFHFERELATSRETKLWRRDREIMRLAWAGKTNAEIAGAAGLKTKSISRIIRRKLRAGWAARHRAQENSSLRSPYTHEERPAGISLPPRPASRALPYSASPTTGENQ